MKLYKFRPLGCCKDLCRIQDIIEYGFYCNNFLDFNDMNEGVFTVNKKNWDISVIEKQKYKICSFSGDKAFNNPLMWGHYANAGMGVVIEIEVGDTEVERVEYRNDFKDLHFVEDILTNKTKEWEYENEFRYLRTREERFIFKEKIKKIHFGAPYKELLNYDKIKKKHTKLKEYLKLKKRLKSLCKKQNIVMSRFSL